MEPTISNIRYGPIINGLGTILFDANGITCRILEPCDVILVGTDENLACKWIKQRYSLLLTNLPDDQLTP